MMRRFLVLLIAISISACATSKTEQSAVAKDDAIEDYIQVSELESVDKIRTNNHMRYTVLTDYYVLLSDRRKAYMLEFTRRCRELDEQGITPDIRSDRNELRARFDTYRGCRIGALYSVNEGQVTELKALGD